MILENQIRKNLSAFLNGRMSQDRFEHWMEISSVDSHLDSRKEAHDLAVSINQALLEHNMGLRTDEETLQFLRRLLTSFSFSAADEGAGKESVQAWSTAATLTRPFCLDVQRHITSASVGNRISSAAPVPV